MAGKNVEGQLELFSLFDSVEELEQKIKGAGLKEVQGEPVMEQCYRHRDTGETAVAAYLDYNRVYVCLLYTSHKPVLFDGGMAFNHAVSADVCNDFFLQRRADRIHEVGAPHLLCRHGYFRGADCMPDDIYLDRQCGGFDHCGDYA